MSLAAQDQELLAAQIREEMGKALKEDMDAFGDQVLYATSELDQAARKALKDFQEEAARSLQEAKKEIAGLREHVKQLEGHFREEDASMRDADKVTIEPFALADDLSNLPAEDSPLPLALTYRGRTLTTHARVSLALHSARRLGHIPEAVFQDPLDSLGSEMNRLSLEKDLGDSGLDVGMTPPQPERKAASKRRRRQRRPRRPARERREAQPRFPRPIRSREPAWQPSAELRQAQADLMRIRAERERLRLEVLALKTHCRSTGVGEPRVPLPPASCFGSGKS